MTNGLCGFSILRSRRRAPISHLFLLAILVVPLVSQAATKLDFDSVLRATLRHSYDIRMAAVDIGISKSQLKEARSAYFPALSLRFNFQYTKDLTNATASQVTAVGETILVQNTFFQNSLSFNGSLNLYDFGAREDRVFIAAKDIPLKRAVHLQSVRDTKVSVLQTYRDLLLITGDLSSRQELLVLYQDLALTTERLCAAGLASKVDVSDQAIKVVKLLEEINNLKLKLSSSLQDLSFLTGEKYGEEGLKLAALSMEQENENSFSLSASPEYRIYQLALERKRAELNLVEKELFYPQFGLYSNYILYGQDPSSYKASCGDFKERNFYVGLVASIPIFDGFKKSAHVDRAKLEMERIQIEKEKKLSELSSRYEKLREETRVLERTLANQRTIMAKTEDNTLMTGRLADQKVVDHIEYLKRQIEFVSQRQEIVRAETLKSAAVLELRMLADGE
jgi:outer membrane protein